jgi:hypothetical protein
MTTRFSNKPGFQEKVNSGYTNDASEFTMPSCTIEDVDRGVFDLFDKELPFYYKRKDSQKKVPVIFATGERFALLARNKPLRDKSDALILPLISIVRSGIEQENAKGASQFQGGPITIKASISKEDPIYQRYQNKFGFKNSDDVAIDTNSNNSVDGIGGSSDPGRIATRRQAPAITVSARKGTILEPSVGKNLFEFIEIPPIKQYTASYEITFWAQYTQEMNSMLTVIMNGYVENRRRTLVIETKDGYRFVAYVDAALSPQNNFDDFTDAERLVKYSFTMTVGAYLVASSIPGAPVPFRKTISAPEISFDTSTASGPGPTSKPVAGIASGDPAAAGYVLQDILTEEDGYPPQSIGGSSSELTTGFPGKPSAAIGGYVKEQGTLGRTVIITDIDPFTGERATRYVILAASTPNKGETVFRFGMKGPEGIELDLGKLLKD